MFIFVLCSSQTVKLDKQLNKNRKITIVLAYILGKLWTKSHGPFILFQCSDSRLVSPHWQVNRFSTEWYRCVGSPSGGVSCHVIRSGSCQSLSRHWCWNQYDRDYVSKSIKCLFMTFLVGHTKANMSSRFNHFPSCVLFDSRNLGCPQVCKRLLVLVLDLEHGWRDMFIYFHLRIQW